MKKVFETAGRIGINLNTLVLGLLVGLIQYEGGRAAEAMRTLDRLSESQRIYVPKIENIERDLSDVRTDVSLLKQREREQDAQIELLIKQTK